MREEHKYDDIINLEHNVSKKHKRMSLENRSAQFAPFSALTGYGDAVEDTIEKNISKYTEKEKDDYNEYKYL